MTYTREQVEACVRGAVMDWIGAIIEGQDPARESFAAVQDAAAIGAEILHRLDQVEPVDLEPNPTPKEDADEKRTHYKPVDPYLDPPGECRNCGRRRHEHDAYTLRCPR